MPRTLVWGANAKDGAPPVRVEDAHPAIVSKRDFQKARRLLGSRAPKNVNPRRAAVMDWHSRKVLAWRVSVTMDTDFCVEALEESLGRHGAPEIFNTDQGSQFTSDAFTGLLKANGIQISMDGKGSWKDNVFVERLWKSVKYEEVYLRAYESVPEARTGLGRYFEFYNAGRPHSSLGGMTPDQFFDRAPAESAAA